MANRCAGLDSTWAHLPAPAPPLCHSTSSWRLFPAAAAFETEALTSALRASMSPANAAATSSSHPVTPSSSSFTSELLSGGDDAPASSRTTVPPALMGTRAGRVTKRKPRPSRRPPITYIVADTASFRRMVQEVTGFPVVAASGARLQAAASAPDSDCASAPSWLTPPTPAFMLPTLDTSAFLLDHRAGVSAPARGPEDGSSSGGASPTVVVTAATAAAVEDDDDSSVMQELGAPGFVSDFPTLESWGII